MSSDDGSEARSTQNRDSRLQQLVDKDEIHSVLALYCRGIDRLDPELIQASYWPDAVDDHGQFRGAPPEFVDYVVSRMARREGSMHVLGTVNIQLHGDSARSESYFTAYNLEQTQNDVRRLDVLLGRYVDRFERRDGEWRIAARLVVKLAGYAFDIDEPTGESFVLGLRGHHDPAYTGPSLFGDLARG